MRDLIAYQETGVFSVDRNTIANFVRVNPFMFFTQLEQPDYSLEQQLVEPLELLEFINPYNISAQPKNEGMTRYAPANCANGFVTTEYLSALAIFWVAISIVLYKLFKITGMSDNAAHEYRLQNRR